MATTPNKKQPAFSGKTPVRAKDEDENSFWSTPSVAQQSSLQQEKSDMLLDESFGELGDALDAFGIICIAQTMPYYEG